MPIKNLNLTQFPAQFQPLVIVSGDRREDPPKTKGDMLAYSGSALDLTYVLYLGLKDIRIISDKTFVLDDEEQLRNRFGQTHILALGSPAVNLLSRKINDSSLFRFDIPETAKEEMAKHDRLIDTIKFDPVELLIYQEIFKRGLTPEQIKSLDFKNYIDVEELHERSKELYAEYQTLDLKDSSWKNLMHNFDLPGIFDPMDATKHAHYTRPYNDFGLISLAPNPFAPKGSKKYYVIVVAGIHGMATSRGVRLLADDDFIDRPFGGVFEVQFPTDVPWHQKMEKGRVKWQTRPYKDRVEERSVEDLTPSPTLAFSVKPKVAPPSLFISSPYENKDTKLKALILTIEAKVRERFAGTTSAYSIKYSGSESFADAIAEKISSSVGVIHVLNELKSGVLFEIGISVGTQCRFFLVWDPRRDAFREKDIPQCIRHINIIQLDTQTPKRLASCVEDNIIVPLQDGPSFPDARKRAHDWLRKAQLERRARQNPPVFVWVSATLKPHAPGVHAQIRDFRLSPLSETELVGEDPLVRHCYGVRLADMCIYLLDERDRDGVVMLGVAKALKKPTLVLRENQVGMFNGDYQSFTQATVKEDVEAGVRTFLQKQTRQSARPRRGGKTMRTNGVTPRTR